MNGGLRFEMEMKQEGWLLASLLSDLRVLPSNNRNQPELFTATPSEWAVK
jgi:hypothetical protein